MSNLLTDDLEAGGVIPKEAYRENFCLSGSSHTGAVEPGVGEDHASDGRTGPRMPNPA